MSKKRKRARLGSISHGTMRTEDLLPEFVYTLRELNPRHPALKVYNQIMKALDGLDSLGVRLYDEWWKSDLAVEMVNESLLEALNELAPDYCYFGTSEGNGSDYGFWIDWHRIEDDSHGQDACILKLEAGNEWPRPLPEGTEYVLEINDHGNCTLFNRRHRELWSCV